MTPVAKTGLHCGLALAVSTGARRGVTPVAKTGLHCGSTYIGQTTKSVEIVTPVAKTGLHCGGEQPLVVEARNGG